MTKCKNSISLIGTAAALIFSSQLCYAQKVVVHPNAHAHNDYEHSRPLMEALQNGFLSVEADVHRHHGELLVAHDQATNQSPKLEYLYLKPLDSLLQVHQGFVYPGEKKTFFLMIDIKSNGEETYRSLQKLVDHYERLKCSSPGCPVRIFLSGNRPLSILLKEGYKGMGIDGRPEDLGKGYAEEWMPVISDTYKNWSSWDGHSLLKEKDLERIRDLAKRVHAEGKKLRLWAIPDHEKVWGALWQSGVDLINTDHLPELNAFLMRNGL